MERARRRLGQALVIYRDDAERIARALSRYRASSNAHCSLLVDLDGHLVTQSGSLHGVDHDALAALAAGSFLAVREVARALGEEDFTTLVRRGGDECVQLALVDDRILLATVHAPRDEGLVAFFARSAIAALRAVLDEAWSRPPRPLDLDLSDAFEGWAQ